MKKWQMWYFGIATVLVILFASTTVLLYTKALPFPDLGHRSYGVENATEGRAMEDVFKLFLGEPIMRFDAGPTHQIVFKDGTVILWLDSDFKEHYHLSSSAPSFVCEDPNLVADSLVKFFETKGYSAQWFDVSDWKIPGQEFPQNTLTIIKTSAFNETLVLRRHVLDMPAVKEWNW